MKFALMYGGRGVSFMTDSNHLMCTLASGLGQADLFDTPSAALDALQKSVWGNGSVFGVTLVGVEEIPGETRHEIVELEGVVDLTGLKFTVAAHGGTGQLPNGHHVYDRYGKSAPLCEAALSPTHSAAVVSFNRRVNLATFDAGCRIVGIREVTTEPTRRIVELG